MTNLKNMENGIYAYYTVTIDKGDDYEKRRKKVRIDIRNEVICRKRLRRKLTDMVNSQNKRVISDINIRDYREEEEKRKNPI